MIYGYYISRTSVDQTHDNDTRASLQFGMRLSRKCFHFSLFVSAEGEGDVSRNGGFFTTMTICNASLKRNNFEACACIRGRINNTKSVRRNYRLETGP